MEERARAAPGLGGLLGLGCLLGLLACGGAADPGAVPGDGPAATAIPGATWPQASARGDVPSIIVLGIAQDGGFPQIGTPPGPTWAPERRRRVSSLALVDPSTGQRWLFDATPDIAEQLAHLDEVAPRRPAPTGTASPIVDGVFLTHAHMGHYTGLMQFGREALGARGINVYAMPRMRTFLETNGPWAQLVELGNVQLTSLQHGVPVQLNARLSVTPLLVPHRDEYSETVGFVIEARGAESQPAEPTRALYLPDIDKWERWDAAGTRLEDVLEQVDVAWIDGTFMRDGEIPGRAMDEIPHPFMIETMQRLEASAPHLTSRVRFIHLNRTNPALLELASLAQTAPSGGSGALAEVRARGFDVAREGEVWELRGGR